jgi:hypothetical protein
MSTRNLTILDGILSAAKALAVVGHHGTPFLKQHAVKGLHSALIAAEEVRQDMADELAKASTPIQEDAE